MRKKILNIISRLSFQKTNLMLVMMLILTLVAVFVAKDITLSMQFKDLMPQNHPLVKRFNNIIDNYDSASSIILTATGNKKSLIAFVEDIAPLIQKHNEFFKRVDYKRNTDFFLKHGFMLQKNKDLQNSLNLYENLNLIPWFTRLNDSFEKTYIDDDESISTKQKENNAIMMLNGVNNLISGMSDFLSKPNSKTNVDAIVKNFLVGNSYYLSPDNQMIMMFIQPKFTVEDVDTVIKADNLIDKIIRENIGKYPGITAGITGTMALSRDEMVAVQKDMNFTTIIALVLILFLLILSFKMWSAPILAGVTMIAGIIWTTAFATITVGSLNAMTSMFGVIILGLGIDFSIHIISIFTELRAENFPIEKAMRETLEKSGGGIITGALTTAFAFFALMISKSVGMHQFGLIAGSGIILSMLATLLILPSLLIFHERIRSKKKVGNTLKAGSLDFKILKKYTEFIGKYPKTILLLCSILTIMFFMIGRKIKFDYNYLNMEPKGLTSIKLQHLLEKKFDMTPDYALVSVKSVKEARKISHKVRKLNSIGFVSSISDYLPSEFEQRKRKITIDKIRRYLQNNKKNLPVNSFQKSQLIEQIERLQDNIIELSQLAFIGGQDKLDKKTRQLVGNPQDSTDIGSLGNLLKILKNQPGDNLIKNINSFQKEFSSSFRKYSLSMCSTENLTVKKLPKDIKNRFLSNSGDEFLVSIYPKSNVWNLRFLKRFKNQMQKIDNRITGMPLVYYTLIKIVGKDGRNSAMLAILVIYILLLLDFRSLKIATIAMIPLIFGTIWMIGLMWIFGIKLTTVNVMGLPLILGIGVDDGVHILHRYLMEKSKNIPQIFNSTGKAIFITSLTTMIGFGSLTFASYRGLGSLGITLFLGVAGCLLVTITIMPAILKLLEK